MGQDVSIRRVQLIDLPLRQAHVSGSVQGSPIVAGEIFLGFEHPLSESKVDRRSRHRLDRARVASARESGR